MEKKNWLTVYCGIDSVPASLVSHESWQGLIRAQNPAEAPTAFYSRLYLFRIRWFRSQR